MQMGKGNQPRQTLTILVVKERGTKMLMATVVPSKSTGRFVAERVNAFIKQLGIEHLDAVAKSDQEPAIKSLIHSERREKRQDISVDHSPVAEHQSNGVAERAAKTVQGQALTLKLAAEARISEKIVETSDIIPWMGRRAAMLVNIGQRGEDGRSALGTGEGA